MLARPGVDPQHEHETRWAAGPGGRRGGCDRELHADADRRVHACQPAVSRVTPQEIGSHDRPVERFLAREIGSNVRGGGPERPTPSQTGDSLDGYRLRAVASTGSDSFKV